MICRFKKDAPMTTSPCGPNRNALRYVIDQELRTASPEAIREAAFSSLTRIRMCMEIDRETAKMTRRACRDWLIDQRAFEDAAWERE